MFEHVGEKYWPTYFQKIKSSLKPQGKAVIQSITVDDKVFDETHGKTGFIEHYIFPGGMLPSKRRFCEEAAKQGLKVMEVFSFGDNYALTLRHWLERFEQQVRKIKSMGYDDSFIRLWRFYLSACIACFISKRSDVMQVELINPE
jgi:cyclopropane-fatty-acyl-phospholipid synthase